MQKSLFNVYQFEVTGKASEEYGEWVNKTAKLLNRPYMQIHQLFTRENWTTEEIKRAYVLATKHSGNLRPSVFWWWQRKQRKGVDK